MPHPADLARKVCSHSRRLMHPIVDSFLPVNYTSEEWQRRIRELDPRGARSDPAGNPDTDRRIVHLAAALGVEETVALRHLDEARQVRLAEPGPAAGRDLPSPMCREDRYATYVVTRIAQPVLAVETGIAHGVSSAYILSAMEARGAGQLISLEVDDDPRIGQQVPASLRDRWATRTGNSLEFLPPLFETHGLIDLFLHDSDHAVQHVQREFALVWPHLRPGGVLCAHDVLHNNAFPRFVRKHESEIDGWTTSVNFGVLRKRL